MKKIVLIALLAAAGCSKKGSGSGAGGDCEAAMTKGTDGLLATVKSRAPAQQVDSLTEMVGKMKTTLTTRCNEDKWSAEAIDCFTKLNSQQEMRGCEQKLTEEQRNKLRGEMRQLMGSMRMGPNHPPALGSGAPPAPGTVTPPAGDTPPAATPPATGGTAAPGDPPATPATPPAAGSGSSASGW
jgi:hypothetical protein